MEQSAKMSICLPCLMANNGKPVHQAQLLIQSTVVSQHRLVQKLKMCADAIARDPEIAVYVVDDMEDADQFADVEQRRPVKRERCIQDVKAANAEKGCRPAGDGSRQCPNPWAVCSSNVK